MITVLIPAHNEAAGIVETLKSLKGQTRRPDRVIVVADNCTDATEHIALAWGAEVLRTKGNSDQKAGALNFALGYLLPDAGPEDMILIQGADSQLSPLAASNSRLYGGATPQKRFSQLNPFQEKFPTGPGSSGVGSAGCADGRQASIARPAAASMASGFTERAEREADNRKEAM